MPFVFEMLFDYQKSVDFVGEICTATEHFQRAYGCLVDQLNRALHSIVAIIADGNDRFTKPDRRNFIGIAWARAS